ncbi:hypothetical protein F53441_651 [Fusarium austroafricanum]|uniref:Helicase C-terminal domain-containing protein n=1 Tax=Fusarium austroafricanum TaxID=2364996 RepID=A0A8H4P354_9HYPO|nr:hypothetical protein F53441_651 [Fusarium austroafricanum]
MEPRKLHDSDEADAKPFPTEATGHLLAIKIFIAIQIIIGWKTKGKRMLIFTREKSTAAALHEKLEATTVLSQNLSLWSDSSIPSTILRDFDTPNNTSDVLIMTPANIGQVHPVGTPSDASVMGIMFDIPESYSQYQQVTSCLGNSFWSHSYIFGTLDRTSDQRLHRQMVESKINREELYPASIEGELRLICAYYDAAHEIGHKWSRYPRTRVHWTYWETEELFLECSFYFAVGKFLRKYPESWSKFNSDTMEHIAES